MSTKIFCVLFLAGCPYAVFGQNTGSDTVDYYTLSLEELMNIPITTASKFKQSIKDAPSTISLITRDQIAKYGWISANEVVYRLPGFSMSRDYERQTLSSRGIHEGWNNNHMLMLIDGVPVNENMYGSALTSEITPLLFTKSLEVIRGPGSALYGSNATNGVISYNTLSASDLDGNVEARYRTGNDNTQLFDFLVGHEAASVSFISAFNYFETDGDTYKSLDASNTQQFDIIDKRASFYLFNKIEGKGRLAGFTFQHHEQSWDFSSGYGWLFYVPDQPENLKESRRLLSLSYRTPETLKKFTQEYQVRYQRHQEDWNLRLLPDNTIGYPFGLTEMIKTRAYDIFSRAQWSYSLGGTSVILGGIENTTFLYRGDELHLSNANLNTDFSPSDNNELVEADDYLGWITSHPVVNLGFFAQYTSPKWLDKLQATVGVRYDYSTFSFNALDKPGVPDDKKSFDKFSPRVSLVYTAADNLTVKLMGGRAFRAPVAGELFGANTYVTASNLRGLRPEVITTYELAMDFKINRYVNWRMNFFNTTFEDQIAYSASNFNLSTNLYSLNTIGAETEFLFGFNKIDGFLNYAYADRIDEEIKDPTISISKDVVTWVPQHVVNLGLAYNERYFYFSVQSHYQGDVRRRSSDQNDATNALRDSKVDSWVSLDARVALKPITGIEIALQATNLLDEEGKLIKKDLFPFDYQIPGRRILLDVRLKL